jgi:2-C-methyl-D-erythritol 4-phosphate cytidylyltransferase
MEIKHFIIITAGGRGLRMGEDIPKQFLCLQGLPVIMHTINCFKSFTDTIILTLPEQYFNYWKEIQQKYNFHVPHILVSGGETRFHSVKNALKHLPNEGFVAIHDAVRPFVSQNLIKLCFEQAQKHGSAVAAIPVKDSLRMIYNSKNKRIDRSNIFAVQTLQVFSCEIIKKCYNQVFKPDFTDDASVVETFGYDIHLVEGEELNFKITTPNDLIIAENLMTKKIISTIPTSSKLDF